MHSQRREIETAALELVAESPWPDGSGSLVGTRLAIESALDYWLIGLEHEAAAAAPIPTALTAQARAAARAGVGLDLVLQRFNACYTLLGDLLLQAAEDTHLSMPVDELRRIWRIQTASLDRLAMAIAREYADELRPRVRSTAEIQAQRVRRLLDGQLVEVDELRYDFDAWHLGLVARGPSAPRVLRALVGRLDCQILSVNPDPGTVWAWLGRRSRITAEEVERLAPNPWPTDLALSVGEAARGMEGWRLSHRQAEAAEPIASRPRPRLVRYAAVALLASAIGDEILAGSLRGMYLDPLEDDRDGGATSRRTLRAYFAARRNVSSAAATLGVSRQTVTSRLRSVEDRIGRSLDTCAAELETALSLNELKRVDPSGFAR